MVSELEPSLIVSRPPFLSLPVPIPAKYLPSETNSHCVPVNEVLGLILVAVRYIESTGNITLYNVVAVGAVGSCILLIETDASSSFTSIIELPAPIPP